MYQFMQIYDYSPSFLDWFPFVFSDFIVEFTVVCFKILTTVCVLLLPLAFPDNECVKYPFLPLLFIFLFSF